MFHQGNGGDAHAQCTYAQHLIQAGGEAGGQVLAENSSENTAQNHGGNIAENPNQKKPSFTPEQNENGAEKIRRKQNTCPRRIL